MELEKSTMFVIIIMAIGLVLGIGLFILGQFQTSVFTNSTATSATQNVTALSSATLTPVGAGITTSEVKANNQTWLDFDGNDDLVNISVVPDLKTLSNWSISVMASTNDTGGYIVGFGDSTQDDNFIGITFFSNDFQYNSQNNAGASVSRSFGGASDNETYFLTLVSNDGAMQVFRDGVDFGSSANINYSNFDTFDTFHLGALERTSLGLYWNGTINNFIFNDIALTQFQVTNVYNETLFGRGIPIIYYHGIGDDYSPNISVANFTIHMDYLNAHGFETILPSNILDWQQGTFALPDKPIVIIFDDGVKSVKNATSIMDGYGFVGSLALITNETNDNNSQYLNWTEVSEFSNKGWEILSHSYNHSNSTNISSSEFIIQLNQSKQDIINNLGITPKVFVFPLNDFNSTTRTQCNSYYNFCSGASPQNSRVYINSNLTGVGLVRTDVGEDTITEYLFQSRVNTYPNVSYNYRINENSGTTLNDASGNSNDGTITGATWATDGALKTLTAVTDYTINTATGLFTIVNSDYSWSQLQATWSYSAITDSTGYGAMTTMRSGLANFADWIALIVIVIAAAIVLGVVLSSFGRKRNAI